MQKLLLLLILLLTTACGGATFYTQGVPNFRQVDPGVYRSGQPTTLAEWEWLKKQGIHHVIKLNYEDEGSEALALQAGLDVHVLSIPPKDLPGVFEMPDPKKLQEAEALLELATPNDAWLVHCTHGHDRTGLVVGRFRVLHDLWSKNRAYSEMLQDGFHPLLHGLHESWEQFDNKP